MLTTGLPGDSLACLLDEYFSVGSRPVCSLASILQIVLVIIIVIADVVECLVLC